MCPVTGRADGPRMQPPSADAKHQAQSEHIAILDPQVLHPDVVEHLSGQVALLGRAILAQQLSGNQDVLLFQHHSRVTRSGSRPDAMAFLEAMSG